MSALYPAGLVALMPDAGAFLPETPLSLPGSNLLNDSKRLSGLGDVSGNIYVLDGK
jgi:hypothetical protein